MSSRLATVVALLATVASVPAPAEPQTIVVSATRHAMAEVDAPAAVGVVTRAQIEARGADNLLEALRGETGISIQGRTISGRKVISLRGMDSRHTLVLVDGKRIGASDGVIGHSDFQLDWIAVQDIERIEVVRGPMSVLYGAEALGGVVNIITRAPGERWQFDASAEGSWADGDRGGDGHRAALRAAGPLGGAWRLAVTVADTRRQALDGSADARISDLEGRHKRDLALRLQWRPAAGQQFDAEHLEGDEDRWAGARERSGAKRYYDSLTAIERRHDALSWSADWGGALDLRSKLRAYRSALAMSNARTAGVAALRPNTLDDRVLEGQLSLTPTRTQTLTTGFEARREQLDNLGLPDGRARADHHALYLQDEVELAPTLALTAGLRHDRHERFGREWSPRVYAVWHPAPGWTVKGGAGHGFKAPTLKQISADYREDEGPNTFFGNAALRPETSNSVEAGAGWEGGLGGVQLMVFDNRVDDLIVPRLFGQEGPRALYLFENIDQARLRGAELATRLQAGYGVTLALNYQYLDARDGDGQRLEKRPRHALGARLDWTAGRWRAGLRIEHAADQLLASPVPGQGLQPVPGLTFVGAHAGIDLGGGLDLGLGVDNLTNVRLLDKSPLFIYSEMPRTWRIALRGTW